MFPSPGETRAIATGLSGVWRVLCALCSVECAVFRVRYVVCTVKCVLCSVQCIVCGVYCAVCCAQFVLFPLLNALLSV